MKLFSELTIPDCCFLSLLQADSNSDLLNLITDREISKYLPGIANMETLESVNEIITLFERTYQEEQGALGGIYLSEDTLGGIIGISELKFEPIIFYALSQQYRNRGVMTLCVNAVTEYIHRQYITIKARIDDKNKASQRALEKCGYKYETTLDYYFHHKNFFDSKSS